MSMDRMAIERFLHGQIDCWNKGDKQGFFDHYKSVSANGLDIEYVGRPPQEDAWQVLEGMWAAQQPKIRVEVRQCIINGNEAACHHLNALREQEGGIETIELYQFGEGTLSVRYFIDL
ncbi:MAG: nuclear transport factor 2 family protein [Pseudomonas sp.]|uniref:nuclear transport factor 2 family protein n=1 Tax=Pseudomonas abieticivorans TaxID=2931382 RepID=UPI0020BDCF2F|nr:nuclear transport factor 2 family protein [Pseudomonas sp. PIA16]MDE1164389.1 nuclear transport factor 2 family protein [Pseudomonas sp.]